MIHSLISLLLKEQPDEGLYYLQCLTINLVNCIHKTSANVKYTYTYSMDISLIYRKQNILPVNIPNIPTDVFSSANSVTSFQSAPEATV